MPPQCKVFKFLYIFLICQKCILTKKKEINWKMDSDINLNTTQTLICPEIVIETVRPFMHLTYFKTLATSYNTNILFRITHNRKYSKIFLTLAIAPHHQTHFIKRTKYPRTGTKTVGGWAAHRL